MVKPGTALLIDAENVFRGETSWDFSYAAAVFDALVDTVAAGGPVQVVRSYGKFSDDGARSMRDIVLAREERRWVVVGVVKGEDVADDALLEDLALLVAAGKGLARHVVVSSDKKVLAGAMGAGNAHKKVEVVLSGSCSDQCPSNTLDVVGHHRHVLGIYRQRKGDVRRAVRSGGRGSQGAASARAGRPAGSTTTNGPETAVELLDSASFAPDDDAPSSAHG